VDDDANLDFNRELHELPEHRRELIFRIRRQIAEGTYDDEQKLELALDRLLDRLEVNADDPQDHHR
jgi:hypothetical protein